MPKRTIDELLAAIDAVEFLREAVRKHDTAIEQIADKLDLIERRLAILESGPAVNPT